MISTTFMGGSAVDDRGQVTFVNDFDFKGVKRFYMVSNHRRGFIRAFHYHRKEGKYVFVANGSILLVTAKVDEENLDNSEVEQYVLSDKQPKIVYIPPGYANGFKSLEENTKVIFYSTSTLEDSLGDDVRYAYNKWCDWEENYR